MSSNTPPALWTLLSVVVPSLAEEPVVAAFLREDDAARAAGLIVEDAEAGVLATGGTPVGDGEVRVSFYVTTVESMGVVETLRGRLRRLVELELLEAVPEIEARPVDDDDWRERWKDFFHVTHVSDRLVVRPPWRVYEPKPGDIVLHIEPGLAFGTGGHQTTQLSLRAVERAMPSTPSAPDGISLLDVGCGSGVLSIAAVQLGAARALAIDIDPESVAATRENAERNGVSTKVVAAGDDLASVVVERRFQMVVANIISGTLLSLRDDLLRAPAPGGILVLSGVLAEEEASFREDFEANQPHLTLLDIETMDEWLGLTYRVGEPEA